MQDTFSGLQYIWVAGVGIGDRALLAKQAKLIAELLEDEDTGTAVAAVEALGYLGPDAPRRVAQTLAKRLPAECAARVRVLGEACLKGM